jgi:hypothetical protein
LHSNLKTTRNILSGLLALFVLMSSISHSVSFHICGGEIESMAVFGKAPACAGHNNVCHHDATNGHSSIHNTGCCEDATVLIDSDKYASKTTEKATVESAPYIFIPITDLVQEINPYAGLARVHFSKYRPPSIERDITILVQTFLI